MMETKERHLRLLCPGCDAETFKLFIHYASENSLPEIKKLDVNDFPTDVLALSMLSERRCRLIQLWVLADYLGECRRLWMCVQDTC